MAKKKGKKGRRPGGASNAGKNPATKPTKASGPAKKGRDAKATAQGDSGKKAPAKRERPGQRLWVYLVPPLLLIVGYVGLSNYLGWTRGAESAPIKGTEAKSAIDKDTLAQVPSLLSKALGKQVNASPSASASARLGERNHGVYVALRRDGQLIGDQWSDGGTVGDGLVSATTQITKAKPRAKQAETAEICIAHSFRQIDGDRRSNFGNIYRGVRGLELETRTGAVRLAPTTMLAQNLNFEKALGRLAKTQNLKASDVSDEALRTFQCNQILVDLAAGTAESMYRGNKVVELSSVNKASTIVFRDLMISWLVSHVHADGRMTYKWWPSLGREASSNNMIRQWMATAALAKSGHDRSDQSIFDLTEKNIDHNLSKFYREDSSGHGYILYNQKAKLGAMALAAFSMYLHPKREKWIDKEEAILKTINSLLQDSGRYTTFYLPKGRNDNENFYPGETQLYLATRYVDEKDPAMLEHIMRAFRFYRQWHRDNRNPAFIPWHTQAYFTLWEVTKDKELVDFIFEMNDWLVDTMLQWKTAKTPDAKGRFYNPYKRYGPPHASATGVYLEGLIDAYKLAREVGDDKRRKKYARAMVRGLRSSMQVQFVDDLDMFYIKKKDRVRGGMRTTIYDNTIRVDNVQHTLMGVLKIVDEVSEEDWVYGASK